MPRRKSPNLTLGLFTSQAGSLQLLYFGLKSRRVISFGLGCSCLEAILCIREKRLVAMEELTKLQDE
jgi:hypothetical protein